MAATKLRRLHATVGQMQKNLECSICLDLLRDPVSTKCDHQFCSFCIQSLLSARKKPSAPCPLCKKTVTKRSLTKNERMNEIVCAVRGVANALEDDTGIRCTPPKGPPSLSQSSSQSDSTTSHITTDKGNNHVMQKKNTSNSRSRQNVRRAQTRQPVQQRVHIHIDSDQSDSEGHEVQLVSTNINISSSFPVPTKGKGKGKKGKKQPARKTQRNNKKSSTKDKVESNNSHNSLLNMLESGSLGRKTGAPVTEPQNIDANDDEDNDHSQEKRNKLLGVLDEGSLGMSKDEDKLVSKPGRSDDDEGGDSLPGNTEIISDIFGVSQSGDVHEGEESQEEAVRVEDDDGGCNIDVDEEILPDPEQTNEEEVVHVGGDDEDHNIDGDEDILPDPEQTNLAPESSKDVSGKEQYAAKKKVGVSVGKENCQMSPDDPYEFIASQRTPKKVKAKRGRKPKRLTTGAKKKNSKVTSKRKGIKKSTLHGKNNKVIALDDDDDEDATQLEDEHAMEGTTKMTAQQDTQEEVDDNTQDIGDHPHAIDDDNLTTSSPPKGDSVKETQDDSAGITRIEGLFASQATNDSVDPDEDRGLPLYDYNESSDEEAVPHSDESYKPGVRVSRRRGIQVDGNERRVTRRQKQVDAKKDGNDRNRSCSSAGEGTGGPSLRKRKYGRTGGRKSVRQSASDSAPSKERTEEEDESTEAEVSYIQEHLEECDDVDLYLDGDSQRSQIDEEVRHQKLKNVSSSNEITGRSQKAVVGDVDGNREKDKEKGKKKSSESSRCVSEKKASEAEDDVPIVVGEENKKHDAADTRQINLPSCAKDSSESFKKPLAHALRKQKQPQKCKQDYVSITVPSSTVGKKAIKGKAPEENEKIKPVVNPDAEEVTLVDSQRERKKRSPGGARVFFKAYKRGSIRLDRSVNDDDDDDEDITLADVFGDDTENDVEAVGDDPESGTEEEIPMDTSDVQEQSDEEVDTVTTDNQQDDVAIVSETQISADHQDSAEHQLSTNMSQQLAANSPTSKQKDKSSPVKTTKRSTRNRSRDRNDQSKSEVASEVHQDSKKTSTKNSLKTVAATKQHKGEEVGVSERRSRPTAKKSNIVQSADLALPHGSIKTAGKDEAQPKKTRSRSASKTGHYQIPEDVCDEPVEETIKTNTKRPTKSLDSNDKVHVGNVTPVKSDWELALELAREFGTEPKQFRSRSRTRSADGLETNRPSRRNNRQKPELSMSRISVANHVKEEKVDNKPQSENMDDIESFSSESSNNEINADGENYLHKVRLAKKLSKSNEKQTEVCRVETQMDVSPLEDAENENNEKKKKSKSSMEQEPKTVIPETPLLPAVSLVELVKKSSVAAKEGGRRRRSLRGGNSTQTTDTEEKSVLDDKLTKDVSVESTCQPSVLNPPEEIAIDPEDKVASSNKVVSSKKDKSSLVPMNKADVESKDGTQLPVGNRKSAGHSSDSNDDDIKDVKSSRSSERSSGKNSKKLPQSGDAEVKLGSPQTDRKERMEERQNRSSEKSQRFKRLQRSRKTSDKEMDQDSASSQERAVESRGEVCEVKSARTSRSRTHRSRRGLGTSQSSENESMDGSRSRERATRSRSRSKMMTPLSKELVRKSRRRGRQTDASDAESVDRENSSSRERSCSKNKTMSLGNQQVQSLRRGRQVESSDAESVDQGSSRSRERSQSKTKMTPLNNQPVQRSRRRRQVESSDAESVDQESSRSRERSQRKNKITPLSKEPVQRSRRRIEQVESSDAESIDQRSSRSRERSQSKTRMTPLNKKPLQRSKRRGRQVETVESSDAESIDQKSSRSRERSQSKTKMTPLSKEPVQRSRRRGRQVESSDAESIDQRSSRSRERSQSKNRMTPLNKKPLQRSRRGRQVESSDAESIDQGSSKSRETVSRSQQRSKRMSPTKEPLGQRSGKRRNCSQLSSEVKSPGQKNLKLTNQGHNQKEDPSTQSPLRRSGRLESADREPSKSTNQKEESPIQSPVRRSGQIGKGTPQSSGVDTLEQAAVVTPKKADTISSTVDRKPSHQTVSKEHSQPEKGSSTPDSKKSPCAKLQIKPTRNSPRLSSSAAAKSRGKSKKAVDPSNGNSTVGNSEPANSLALFTEEDVPNQDDIGVSKRDGKVGSRRSADAAKASDTTESIELAISNEEYEQENPDVQQQWSEQPQHKKEDFHPPAALINQNVTKRRRNKLSRKNRGLKSSDTSGTESMSTASDDNTNTIEPTPQQAIRPNQNKNQKLPTSSQTMKPSSCTEIEQTIATSTADDSTTNVVKQTQQDMKELASLGSRCRLDESVKRKDNQKKKAKLKDERRRMPSVTGSETESLCSPQGSESDIFRYSDPIVEDGSVALTSQDQPNDDASVELVARENMQSSNGVSKKINTTPGIGSLDVGTLGSSLESEPILVPPPSHYKQQFERVNETGSPEANDNDGKTETSGSDRRRSKRKSFALGNSQDLQQSKKRKSEENDETNVGDLGKERTTTPQRHSKRHTSQLKKSASKKTTSSPSSSFNMERKDEDVVESNKDDVTFSESCSLQTKRRSRTSGSRRGSLTNTPRSVSVVQSSADEAAINNKTGAKTEEIGKGSTHSPSPGKRRTQRSSGASPAQNDVEIGSTRRSQRKRHSSSADGYDEIPSQTRSSPASVEDEDLEIANSGSLFGTQNSCHKETQLTNTSQKSLSNKIQNDGGEQNMSDEEQEEEISGSQCMFGSNPNTSSEQDVEMMSEGSEDEQQEVEEDTKCPQHTQRMYSEGGSGKPHESNLVSPGVTTIPESAAVMSETKAESPRTGSKKSQSLAGNSFSSASRTLRSSGSASTCVPASENASVSPDKLSDPIKIIRKSITDHNSDQSRGRSSGNSTKSRSLSNKSECLENNSLSNVTGRDKRGSKKDKKLKPQKLSDIDLSEGGSKKDKKLKPQKLSDIDLSEDDVDGDHDLLFEEDEVATLTPVGSNEGQMLKESKKTEDEIESLDDDETLAQSDQLPKTSSPCKNAKGNTLSRIGMDAEKDQMIEDNKEENDGKVNFGKEEEDSGGKDEEEDDNGEENVEEEDIGDDQEFEASDQIGGDDDDNVENEQKVDEDQSREDVGSDDDDDDLIPPTPPCAGNTTIQSLSKTRIGSSSFFGSGQCLSSSSNHRTQTLSSSSNSFSNQSSRSFTFKHPSTTHSQRIGKAKSKLGTRPQAEAVLNDPQSLEESQSLSAFQNGFDSVMDLNALPKKESTKTSSSIKRRKENSSKCASDEVRRNQKHIDMENMKSKEDSKVRGQRRDEDGLTAGPFLQSEQEIEEPVTTEEDESNITKRRKRKTTKGGSKSSASEDKEYDTEASICSDSSTTSHHLNLTSASSVMSSQSELMSTQQQLKAQETLQKMQEEIAQMEATLAKGDDLPADQSILASDSDDQAQDSDDESETELDGIHQLEEVGDGDVDDGVKNGQRKNGVDIEMISVREKPSVKVARKKAADTTGQRRSQKLVYSDEEESDDETNLERDDEDKPSVRQGCSSTIPQGDESLMDPCLDQCPRSPSPPPPLTQSTMQKYTNRTPLQETIESVSKLAEQFKSGSSSSAQSRKRTFCGRDSDSCDDESKRGSYRSRKKRVSRKLSQRRLCSDTESSDEDVAKSESQKRRSVKRRVRSNSESEDEDVRRTITKTARSSKNSTPGSGRKGGKYSVQKSSNNSQDNDRTQMTMADDSQSHTASKKINISLRKQPTSTPHVIENSLPESSRGNSQTQNPLQERTSVSVDTSRNRQLNHSKSPGASAKMPEHGSPVMEMGCKRTLLMEDSAPVVAKNLRKNGGKFSFVATGLSRQELREVERLTKQTGCKFASMFNANTTHVIINTDEDLVCERTLKYFQGIAARVWIVSYTWVEACLKTGDLLPEEGFEIQGDVVNGRKHGGPERARSWKGKPLLQNYEICSVGPYTGLNKDQLVSLLELCGSTTVQHPTLFPFDVGNQYYIVVQQNCNHTQEDYDALYKKYRVPVISREWVLDCVATYSVQPIEDYLLSGDQQPIIELDSDLEEVKL